MPIIKCPNCGQNTSSMALTCPHCSAKIREQIATPTSSTEVGANATSPSATTPMPTATPSTIGKSRSKNRRGCWLANLAIIFLVLCICAMGFFGYQHHMHQQAQLDSLRHELERRIIADQRANEQMLRQAQRDSALWQQTLKAKNIETTQRYIATYPEGIFVDEAYLMLEALQKRQAEAADTTLATQNPQAE